MCISYFIFHTWYVVLIISLILMIQLSYLIRSLERHCFSLFQRLVVRFPGMGMVLHLEKLMKALPIRSVSFVVFKYILDHMLLGI